MPLKLNSTGGGSVTLDVPSTASTYTLTAPAKNGTIITSADAGPAFSAYQNSASPQSIATGTNVKIQFQLEEFDTASCFDNATNYRFTPTVAGYYQVNAQIAWQPGAAGSLIINLYKNGTEFKRGTRSAGNSTTQTNVAISTLIYMNGSTDYIEVYGLHTLGSNLSLEAGGPNSNYFQAFLARAA